MATEQINKHCVFCHPDTTTNPHFKPFGKADLAQVTLFGTDHIFVKPDLLPGRPDGLHFLMIPKPHQFSFASLPHYQNEVGGLIHRIEKVFGHPFVFFEHGSAAEGGKNQSIYHQHGHLYGNPEEYAILAYMAEVLKRRGVYFKIFGNADKSPIANLAKLYRGHSYLYVQMGRFGLIAHDGTGGFPSQITQKAMSRFYGQEVDWKTIPRESPIAIQHSEMARLSVERIGRLIDHCQQVGVL